MHAYLATCTQQAGAQQSAVVTNAQAAASSMDVNNSYTCNNSNNCIKVGCCSHESKHAVPVWGLTVTKAEVWVPAVL